LPPRLATAEAPRLATAEAPRLKSILASDENRPAVAGGCLHFVQVMLVRCGFMPLQREN
jgi:hypothetical protein